MLPANSSLQPVTQINSPTKPDYFQFPSCSHCFKPLFFAHAVSDIWNDSSHYIPCCVPAKKPSFSVSIWGEYFSGTLKPSLPPPYTTTTTTTWHFIASVFLLYFAQRIVLELWFPPVDILYNDFMPVPQAICDEEPTELVPEQYNYQSY